MPALFRHADPTDKIMRYIQTYNEFGDLHELDVLYSLDAGRLRSRMEKINGRGAYRGRPLGVFLIKELKAALDSHNPSGHYLMRRSFRFDNTFNGNDIVARVSSHRIFTPGEYFEPLVFEGSDASRLLADIKRGTVSEVIPKSTGAGYPYPVLVMDEAINLDNLAKKYGMDPEHLFNQFIIRTPTTATHLPGMYWNPFYWV